MSQTQPGAYVLYSERGSSQPPWPAVIYPDDHAPVETRGTRPSGYVTLVLLLTEPYKFRWAYTNQISRLVAMKNEDGHKEPSDIRGAYERATFMQEACIGLDYWVEEVVSQFGDEAVPDPESEDIRDNESEVDEELRQALLISHQDYYGRPLRGLPTPSCSPPKRSRRRSSTATLEEAGASVYIQTRSIFDYHSLPQQSRQVGFIEDGEASSPIKIDDEPPVQKRRKRSTPDVGCGDKLSVKEGKRPRPSCLIGRPLDSLRNFKEIDEPISDVVEVEPTEDKSNCRVLVGAEREVFLIPLKDLVDRPYFRDARTGINYFDINDNGIWTLLHPKLVEINPKDFPFIVEYLTVGYFGIRNPDPNNCKENKDAIAECASAWETAEILGLDDMMEHIANKVACLVWDNADAFIWAIMVYRTPGLISETQDTMRKWVCNILATHFWDFVTDETIGNIFRKRLLRLPQLELDVLSKRAENLENGVKMAEEQDSDEDAL